MGVTGLLTRGFLFGASRTEVHGLEGFLKLLDARKDVQGRERGLITDDPFVWGVLPLRYCFNPDNLRWSLGSYDICFKNNGHTLLSTFFSLGQVLPTHRTAHSRHGGLFQPTITQAIRLLSRGPFPQPTNPVPAGTTVAVASPPPLFSHSSGSKASADTTTLAFPRDDPFSGPHLTYITDMHDAFPTTDPFSGAHLTYTTNTEDCFPAPAAFANRRHAWLHIFPEGKVHQKRDKTMRYFKWGVSRLILESEPVPEMVPIWIEGFDTVMHESRTFPRFVPRVGKEISVSFGEAVDMERRFGDLRERWRRLVRESDERGRRERGGGVE
ncbi:Lyso-phosphatidylcholine acyltransferase [Coniosporium tulheliwenetii]|uniref:Lyso-phosphatidylcholine acyltransferase n=1 Tax=Coniosporium tulheliwenetii TaxID=3383036 RepID=A0ACC2YVS8_9PEZI|nr:Lyso-phosphatidylcholine acyltransferase [Cladosporium sp. JES 115]